MPDDVTEQPANPAQPSATDAPPAEAQQAKPDKPEPTDTVEFWKQKSREQESRAKANADAARKLKEIEDRDLSELEKAKRDRDALSEQLTTVQRTALRNQVALDKQLPADIAAALAGTTEEELAASADRLLAWRSAAAPAPGVPRPDPSQGARPMSPDQESNAEYERYFPPAPTR